MDELDATFVSDLVDRTCEAAVDPPQCGLQPYMSRGSRPLVDRALTTTR
jgi:hypothetical protein